MRTCQFNHRLPCINSRSLRQIFSRNSNTFLWLKLWHRTDSQPWFGDALHLSWHRLFFSMRSASLVWKYQCSTTTLVNRVDSPFFAKPNKAPNKPEALRPICLQYPMNKVLLGIHYRLDLQTIFPFLRQLPLLAYMPHRVTEDCLLIVSSHCRQVRELCTEHLRDDTKKGLWGGIQISLDMQKAFNTVNRTFVSRALRIFDLSIDIQSSVHSWLAPHAYFIPHKKEASNKDPNTSLFSGISPYTWSWHVMGQYIGDDQSFEDLLNTYSDGFLKCTRTETLSNGQKRPGREQRKKNSSSSASTSDGKDHDLIQMVARMALHQEILWIRWE